MSASGAKSTVLNKLLTQYVSVLKCLYGTQLKKVILFGSYARGDFTPDSDIDILILLGLKDSSIQERDYALSTHTYEFNESHGVDIQPVSLEYDQYQKWLPVHPFYKNVSGEGVILYEC